MRCQSFAIPRSGRRFVWLFAALALLNAAGAGKAATAHAETQGERIVAFAASQAGKPYCWAGGDQNGPTRGYAEIPGTGQICPVGVVGFDCTGLTIYAVYQATGVRLPHSGAQGVGRPRLSEAELQPGDLVFFGGTYENFEHAGIYAGNGMFWDASNWGVPVQMHSMAWEQGGAHGLRFVGGARYWSGNTTPPPTPEMPGTDNGGGQIQSFASGRCLDAPGAHAANGTYLQIWDCNGGAQQHWEYSGGQLKIYGNYGKCLDADANDGGANGTNIQLWDCNGGANQQWIAEANGSLRSAAYGRCLDVDGAGTANGTQLQLWDCHGGANQRWAGIPSPNGGGAVRGFASGLCVDVPGASISPGARLQLWECHGGANQQWVMEGSQLRVYGGECLDAVNGGTGNGTPIQAWPCNGGGAQQWEWRADGTIRLKAGGRCLDAEGDGLSNGTQLQLWDCSGVPWQRWTVAPPANGGEEILSAASGRCLDVTGANTSPGARLQIYDCNGAAQQQWVLHGTELQVFGGECLDAVGGGTENGTPIQAWPCNGGGAQQWEWRPDGTIRLKAGGRCLDVKGAGTANQTELQLYDCNGGAWQKWERPPHPAAVAGAGAAGRAGARSAAKGPSCRVPDLKKLSLKQARRRLAAASCTLGKVKRHGRARRGGGKVSHQTAPPEGRFPAGHRVGLTLS